MQKQEGKKYPHCKLWYTFFQHCSGSILSGADQSTWTRVQDLRAASVARSGESRRALECSGKLPQARYSGSSWPKKGLLVPLQPQGYRQPRFCSFQSEKKVFTKSDTATSRRARRRLFGRLLLVEVRYSVLPEESSRACIYEWELFNFIASQKYRYFDQCFPALRSSL